MQTGAAEPALPGRRRSAPLGGQEATRSERTWGQFLDRHDVMLLARDEFVDIGNETVGELLNFFL